MEIIADSPLDDGCARTKVDLILSMLLISWFAIWMEIGCLEDQTFHWNLQTAALPSGAFSVEMLLWNWKDKYCLKFLLLFWIVIPNLCR